VGFLQGSLGYYRYGYECLREGLRQVLWSGNAYHQVDLRLAGSVDLGKVNGALLWQALDSVHRCIRSIAQGCFRIQIQRRRSCDYVFGARAPVLKASCYDAAVTISQTSTLNPTI
jgi:hypothetical protein